MCSTLVIELRDPADREALWLPAFLVDTTDPDVAGGWLTQYIHGAAQTHDVCVTCIITGVGEVIPHGSLTN
jgi:hypothetical protein